MKSVTRAADWVSSIEEVTLGLVNLLRSVEVLRPSAQARDAKAQDIMPGN